MTESRRLLCLAAAINLTLGVGAATAQTVLVRNAPPDSTIEVVLNTSPAGSTKVGASGIATIEAKLLTDPAKTETDAQIFVDVCGTTRRVLLAERGVQLPSPEAGCVRRDMGGIFLVKPITTLVVDFVSGSPTLLLRQGSVSLEPPHVWPDAPTGLVLFGGGSLTWVSNARLIFCGDVTPCEGGSSGLGFTAGAAYWITPYLAAEGSYIRPKEVTASATTDTFSFDSSFKTEVLTAAGVFGVPVGPVRLFGKVGGAYHRATSDTLQTMEARTVVVDGVEQTIPGGNQRYVLKTAGWSWLFSGGGEVWLSQSFALYGEFGRAALKGPSRESETAEGLVDDRMTTLFFGVRLRIGG
jgi:hypothetical protein